MYLGSDRFTDTTYSATYDLVGGVATAKSIYVGGGTSAGGFGVLNVSGGSLTVTDTLTLYNSATGTNYSTIMQSGGMLSATGNVNLGGSFSQTGGIASLGSVGGTGSVTLGGGTALAQMNVKNFSQKNLTISGNGTLTVLESPTRYTNAVTTLTINGKGLIDLSNHSLLIDNHATPFPTTLGYWRAAYNNDSSAGYGLWNGDRGITSSVAKTSAQNDGRITIGYLDGAAQNDPNIGNFAANIGGPALATNQTLLRPCLMGDLNLDGVVDGNDIGIMIGLGYYGKASAPHGWLDGDLNGDGKVDGDDIGLIIGTGTYNNGSYGSKAGTVGTPTLSLPRNTRGGDNQASSTLSGSDAGASTTIGHTGDGKMDYLYDPSTGDVKVVYDVDTRIDAANGHPLQRLRLSSAAGKFRTANLNTNVFATATNTNTLLDCGQTAGAIPDGYDLGMVLPANLTEADLMQDLTLNWQVQSGGVVLKAGDVVVPEPSELVVIGMGAMGLLRRRAMRTSKASR